MLKAGVVTARFMPVSLSTSSKVIHFVCRNGGERFCSGRDTKGHFLPRLSQTREKRNAIIVCDTDIAYYFGGGGQIRVFGGTSNLAIFEDGLDCLMLPPRLRYVLIPLARVFRLSLSCCFTLFLL